MLLEKASKFSIDEIHKKFENYLRIDSYNKYSNQLSEYLEQRLKDFRNLEQIVNLNHSEIVEK